MAASPAKQPDSAPGRVREFQAAADELDRLAKHSRHVSEEERERYARPVAKMLRETAEVAYNVSGSYPSAWTHYMSARRAFGSDAALALALGVNRSRVARWKQGERPDPANGEKLRDFHIVVSLLTGYLEDKAIPDWLHGFNPHLSDRRPVDVLRSGRLSEVVRAIEAEKSGAFA